MNGARTYSTDFPRIHVRSLGSVLRFSAWWAVTENAETKEKQRVYWWTHKGSNLGPLPCEGNALPLSYASGICQQNQGSEPPDPADAIVVRRCDLRSAGVRCQAKPPLKLPVGGRGRRG